MYVFRTSVVTELPQTYMFECVNVCIYTYIHMYMYMYKYKYICTYTYM